MARGGTYLCVTDVESNRITQSLASDCAYPHLADQASSRITLLSTALDGSGTIAYDGRNPPSPGAEILECSGITACGPYLYVGDFHVSRRTVVRLDKVLDGSGLLVAPWGGGPRAVGFAGVAASATT